MNFTYGSYSVFSKIEPRLRSITTGLDRYLMDIELVFTPHNPPQGALIIDDLHLDVSFGDKKVGVARTSSNSDSFIALRHLKIGKQQEVQQQFELYLSTSALEAVEASRNGSDAIFNLRIFGNITGWATTKTEPNELPGIPWSENVLLNVEPSWVSKPVRGFDDLYLKVPQSEWVKLLVQAGYQKIIFVEIEVPECDAFGAALKHMKDAQADFLVGSYTNAVAECRKALESVKSVIPDKDFCPWDETRNLDTRKDMNVQSRFRLSWCAVRHITHSAHHSNGMKEEFTRPMAQYVLHATYLALSLMTKERDLFFKPERSSPAG
jgi:hypothetical protein